ncbi:MAG: glycine oxidase ThiO [Rhizomicrobium sp.]
MNVIVIGAGIAGLSIGWRLAQAGARVTVIERAQAGGGATLASAGMLAPGTEQGGVEGPDGNFARASAALWPAFAEEVEAVSNHKVGFHRDGTLLVARSDDEARALAARAGSIPSAQLLSSGDARAMEPLLGSAVTGALLDPNEAQVDNRAIGLALARAFVRAGGTLQTNETIVRIDVMDGKVLAAISPFAHYHGDAYVLAAGAWTGRIEGLPPEAMPPIVPVKGEMIALAPAGDGTLPRHVVWGNGVYLVPRHGNLFVGATVDRVGFDTSLTDAAATWLRDRAAGLMPSLAAWDEAEHWAGLRPGSPDDLPIVGQTSVEGLYVAGGQYRNGILLAPALAEVLRSLILERRSSLDISAFDPGRFTKALVA